MNLPASQEINILIRAYPNRTWSGPEFDWNHIFGDRLNQVLIRYNTGQYLNSQFPRFDCPTFWHILWFRPFINHKWVLQSQRFLQSTITIVKVRLTWVRLCLARSAWRPRSREEALSVQNHGRRHLVSEVSPFGSITNKMAAQCLLSSISSSA